MSTFMPSIVARTLGVGDRATVIEQPGNPATVVDPRAVNDERNPIFFATAENKVAPWLEKIRASKPYKVLPGGRLVHRGEQPLTAPHMPRQVSLGHDSNLNTSSGRHL